MLRRRHKVKPVKEKTTKYTELRPGRFLYVVRHTPVTHLVEKSRDEVHQLWDKFRAQISVSNTFWSLAKDSEYNEDIGDGEGKPSRLSPGKTIHNPSPGKCNVKITLAKASPNVASASPDTYDEKTDTKCEPNIDDARIQSNITEPDDNNSKIQPKELDAISKHSTEEIQDIRKLFSDANVDNLQHVCLDAPYRNTIKTLFFIHGVGGSSETWNKQMGYFESLNYIVITMDLIGHGYSDSPRRSDAYTFNEIMEDVEELFKKYHGSENILIGHSYGCSFASAVAHDNPSLVTHLVLISGGSPSPLAPQRSVFSLPTVVVSTFRPCIDWGFNRKAIACPKKSNPVCKSTLDVPSYVLRNIMQGQRWEEGGEEYHSEIELPTLIIHGAQDRVISYGMDKRMHQILPKASIVVVDNASHMVMMEQPDIVNNLIHKFVNT